MSHGFSRRSLLGALCAALLAFFGCKGASASAAPSLLKPPAPLPPDPDRLLWNTTAGTVTYQYDAAGHLCSVTCSDPAQPTRFESTSPNLLFTQTGYSCTTLVYDANARRST